MVEELTGRQLAEAKQQARRVRVRTIRHRIAYVAVSVVALFSGLALFRSLDQHGTAKTTATSTTTTTQSDEGDDESSEQIAPPAIEADQSSQPAPLTTSQS